MESCRKQPEMSYKQFDKRAFYSGGWEMAPYVGKKGSCVFFGILGGGINSGSKVLSFKCHIPKIDIEKKKTYLTRHKESRFVRAAANYDQLNAWVTNLFWSLGRHDRRQYSVGLLYS